MRKQLAIILFILCAAVGAKAQAVLQPLQEETRQPQPANGSLRKAAALALPFFDDFSGSNNLDLTRWNRSGVFVNNRYALEPITINVASFDGLDAQGQPYLANSVTAGASDTLTSSDILLGNLAPADSVYLSFYWQSGGLGDVPDLTENNLRYLVLDFKDNTDAWREVWRQPATGEVTDFKQVFVDVKEARYFHSGFRFRFRNVGLRNGLADVWNLDYVELDKNRRKGQNSTRDIAISQSVSKLLKNYTAMPARQFLQSPESELADEVSATINNLGNFPGAISWRGYIRRYDEADADTFLSNQALVPGLARQFVVAGTPRVNGIDLPDEGVFSLVHGIILNTKEPDPRQRANDSTSRITTFTDYYAYDDGTAEAGFSFVGTGNTQVAQRYDINQPDQIRAFKVYFPRVGRDISGTAITFRVWENDNGVPGETLHQQSFQIQYSSTLNTFYEVDLTKMIPVEGSFFIGWTQSGSQYINIGFDRNETATGRRFTYTASGGWAEETRFEGAIMMRPVLIGEALGLEDDLFAEAMSVFPNPSTGEVNFSEPYENVVVYNVLGKEVYKQDYQGSMKPLQLGHLPPGLYTLRIKNRKAIITKKLILTKP